jgi:hypothetical protein
VSERKKERRKEEEKSRDERGKELDRYGRSYDEENRRRSNNAFYRNDGRSSRDRIRDDALL